MAVHELKTLAPFWNAVASGEKNFEVRKNDRGFQKGDVLVLYCLKTYAPTLIETTKDPLLRSVTYVLPGGQFGIESGFVVMGLKDESSHPSEAAGKART